MARLETAGIANAALNSVAALSDHPFLRNTEANYNSVNIKMAGLPVPDVKGEPVVAPELGAQSNDIRLEFMGENNNKIF